MERKTWKTKFVALAICILFLAVLAATRASAKPTVKQQIQISSTEGYWSTNERISDLPGSQCCSDITISTAGSAHVIWFQNGNLYSSSRQADKTWSQEAIINDVDADGLICGWPSIAADSSGNLYALWRDRRNGCWDIFSSYNPAGSGWQADERVTDVCPPFLRDGNHPRIAVDNTGNVHAVWYDKRSGTNAIYYSRKTSGGTWSANQKVNDSSALAWDPALGVDGQGNVYVAWIDFRDNTAGLYFSYRSFLDNWSPDEHISADVPPNSNIDLTANLSGTVFVAWASSDLTSLNTISRTLDGNWSSITKPNGTGRAILPTIAVDSSNNLHAVWLDDESNGDNIYHSVLPYNGSWGPNVRINDDTGANYKNGPAIAVDSAGSAYATWGDSRELQKRIYFSFWSTTSLKQPIILLPGMTASAKWQCLLFEIGCEEQEGWHWMPAEAMPVAQKYYQPLIDQFNAAGYTEENGYLSVFFYDWRQPLAQNSLTLKQEIDQIKVATGATEVNLVGHSMGGLVGRAYVQSGFYGEDVAHLITIGSPHEGAAKAYPYWEGAFLYRMFPHENIVFPVLMQLLSQSLGPNPVNAVRSKVPSIRDLLPTNDYLYNEWEGDQVIPEATMIHRNLYMEGVNSNIGNLFARTEVIAIAGQGTETPARFFVHPPWQWPYWDDGEPNWLREPEFLSSQGDGTVMASNALLPLPAQVYEFPGIDHGALPGNPDVISTTFAALGIPLPPVSQTLSASSIVNEAILLLTLNGPADATVVDSLGQFVGPISATIPGAEYISNPGSPFKLILIPNPHEGNFGISLEGNGSGTYDIGLLNTFDPPSSGVSDTTILWDTPGSQIEPGITVSFELTYTLMTSPTTKLIAKNPMIQTPVRDGDSQVKGRALPGSNVEVYDADTEALLGTTTTDVVGHFTATLSIPLTAGQQIYPYSNEKRGITVTIQTKTINVYLPLVLRN